MPCRPLFVMPAIALALLLLPACDGPPRTFKSKLVEDGRPGDPGYRASGTATWSSDPGVEPPTPELPSRLRHANDRGREDAHGVEGDWWR